MKDAETNKIPNNKGKRQSNKHVEIVDVNIPMTVVGQQQARHAINLENLISLLMYVEVVRRNLQENICRENQSLGQSNLYNKKRIITGTPILTSHTYTR